MSSKSSIKVSRVAAFAAAAAVANVALFYIGEGAGATYNVGSPVAIDAVMTAIATLVPLSLGAVVASFVANRGLKAQNILVWVGFGFAVLSAPNGWVMSQDTATGLILGAMHVVAALAWLFAVKPRNAA